MQLKNWLNRFRFSQNNLYRNRPTMNLPPPTEKQSRVLWFALTGLAVATVIALIVAAVWGLGRVLNLLSPVLWPLAIAAVLACLLAPVVDFFERKKIPRARAIILVFVFAFAIVVGMLASVIPQVVMETEQLAAKVPEYSERLQTRVKEFIAQPPDFLRHFLPKPPTDANAAGNPENPALASASHASIARKSAASKRSKSEPRMQKKP